jgi:hypothetical protein
MKANMNAVLYGVESGKGDFEGVAYDSTTFHLSVDLGKKSNGKTVGVVSRPFKMGDSTEVDKWLHLGPAMPSGRVPVVCEFDVVATKDGSKLVLLGITPATTAAVPKAA